MIAFLQKIIIVFRRAQDDPNLIFSKRWQEAVEQFCSMFAQEAIYLRKSSDYLIKICQSINGRAVEGGPILVTLDTKIWLKQGFQIDQHGMFSSRNDVLKMKIIPLKGIHECKIATQPLIKTRNLFGRSAAAGLYIFNPAIGSTVRAMAEGSVKSSQSSQAVTSMSDWLTRTPPTRPSSPERQPFSLDFSPPLGYSSLKVNCFK